MVTADENAGIFHGPFVRGDEARPIADFLVGAHAMLQCSALITRDDGFFRDYFKGLKVIVPSAP